MGDDQGSRSMRRYFEAACNLETMGLLEALFNI